MRQEKFEKVVKWKEEPDAVLIMFGTVFILIGFVFLAGIFIEYSPFMKYLAGISLFVVGFIGIMLGIGKGRKVYWRKIK